MKKIDGAQRGMALQMTRLIILALVALLAFERPALATSHLDFVCQNVDRTISELIKFAPNGTGWVNRIQAWFENWYAVFGSIFLREEVNLQRSYELLTPSIFFNTNSMPNW